MCVLVTAATACRLGPAPELPAPVAEVPETFSAGEVEGAHQPLGWWRSFGDPALDVLVDSALAANLDLAEAAARVQEVRALARIAGADRFPQVQLSGSVADTRTPANSGFGEQFAQLLRALAGVDSTAGPPQDGDGGVRRIHTTTYSASLGLSWELDFWGRIGSDAAAAVRDVLASEADAHAVELGVLSEVISGYFQIHDLRQRAAIAAEAVDVLSERARLTEDRYDRGLVTSFELYQVRQDLRTTQAALPLLESQIAETESRLAVLLGRYSRDLDTLLPSSLDPTLVTDPVPAGLPSDLLAQRPDVRAAAERYEAARLRVGARKAELFPRLTLSASGGLQSSDAGGLFDVAQWTTNLVAGLTAPIFLGGRLRANLSASEARYAGQAAAFARTVITAVEEVETALVRYREQRLRHAFLLSQLEEADASVALQSSRYAAGVAGYTDYLDAVRSQLNVRSNLSASGQDLALALLGVHRALGGGWVEDEDASAEEATEEVEVR